MTRGNFYGRSKPFTVKFAEEGPIGLTFIEVGAAVMKVVDATGVAATHGVKSGDHILSINGVVLAKTPRLCNSKYVGNMIRTQPRPLRMAFVRPQVKRGGKHNEERWEPSGMSSLAE
jgi:predicted metalloprotease with PDZ domain